MLTSSVCLNDPQTMIPLQQGASVPWGMTYTCFCRKHKIRLELFYVAIKTEESNQTKGQHYRAYIYI